MRCVVNLRASARKYANIVVFDMHGEYASLADPPESEGRSTPSAIADSYKIAGPGDLDAPSGNTLFLPYWLLNREEMLSMILDRSDQNAPNQSSRFTLHVRELKEVTLIRERKEDVKATFTVDSPIPYALTDLIKKLHHDDTAKGVGAKNKPVKGEWEGRLTRFLSRLEAKGSGSPVRFHVQSSGRCIEVRLVGDADEEVACSGRGKTRN